MLAPLSLLIQAAASDPVPSDNNVKAGWVAFAVVLVLIVAVVFLLRSFTKQLKKVEKANEAGVYDEQPSTEPGLPPTTVERDR
jgi:TRAP-type C4-dicarboxylate transport system permease small subunit